MTKVSIQKAAKLTGKHRDTINAHTKNGKLSYSLDSRGYKEVDLSELERVFQITGTLDDFSVSKAGVGDCRILSDRTVGTDTEALQLKILHLEEIREIFEKDRLRERHQMQDEIDNLRSTLEKAQEQHSKALLLITDQTTQREGTHEKSIQELQLQLGSQVERFEAKLSEVQDTTRQHTLTEIKDHYWWDLVFSRKLRA